MEELPTAAAAGVATGVAAGVAGHAHGFSHNLMFVGANLDIVGPLSVHGHAYMVGHGVFVRFGGVFGHLANASALFLVAHRVGHVANAGFGLAAMHVHELLL